MRFHEALPTEIAFFIKSENNRVFFAFLVMLRGNKLNVVSIYNRFLKCRSEIGVYGVNYIAVSAVRILSRGHNDKESLACVDYLHVVNGKAIVKGYRNDSLHRSFVKKLSDFDVGDLHFGVPSLV